MARAAQTDYADRFATELYPIIKPIDVDGTASLHDLARELNRRNIRTRRGKRWYAATVRNLLGRRPFQEPYEVRSRTLYGGQCPYRRARKNSSQHSY